jgi:hypothetical protein
MSTYKELMNKLENVLLEFQKAELEYMGESHTVDLSPPFIYCTALCEGVIRGCLEMSKGENVESVGMVAGGLVGLTIESGHTAMKRSNDKPGGYQ